MNYIKFDKDKLVNLEYSLQRELLQSNNTGAYINTTIIGCNTRKYHGLFVCPMPEVDNGKHVLLSNLDETVIQHDQDFNLAIHKYPGINVYEPIGHKYIRNFHLDPIPTVQYRVGGVILQKEIMLAAGKAQLLIRYTLLDAHSPTKIRLKPFLAFRNIHYLCKSNFNVNTFNYDILENGLSISLYEPYKALNLQFSKKTKFIAVPHWYYDIEYIEEYKRGYDSTEDLYVPGYFEFDIKKGESIIFSASLQPEKSKGLKGRFTNELKKRIIGNSYEDCLLNSAKQFIVKNKDRTEVMAGFPWFGSWGRDTFIALPGLTLSRNDEKTFTQVIDTMVKSLKNGLFTNMTGTGGAAYNSVDAPLWFFWAMQQYAEYTNSGTKIWEKYKVYFKQILKAYKNGTSFNIKMHDNGLIHAEQEGKALTWMDALVDNKPVTQRAGYAVEINALWYNALVFTLELAKKAKDTEFISEWKNLPELVKNSFVETFWNKKEQFLADHVNNDYIAREIRPNQIFAASLPFSPLTDDMKKSVIETVKSKLLTKNGLRTLSPDDKKYCGEYSGNQAKRDSAYHQGTVWPWLLGHFAEAYLKLHEKSGIKFVEKIYNNFKEDMNIHGIGSISEIYDGNPPHKPKGAISQAWSVAEIIRIKKLIEKYQ